MHTAGICSAQDPVTVRERKCFDTDGFPMEAKSPLKR